MPGKPAARVGDYHVCPMVDGSKPHEGGGIQPVGATCVQVGGKPAARVGDLATCKGPPDVLVMGAMPVVFENQPAARQGDTTAHGGTITEGECTVLIGCRGITGNLHTSKLACQALAKGRDSEEDWQTYYNCGLEACRQIIQWATGSEITEDELFSWAAKNDLSAGSRYKVLRRPDAGGTNGWDETQILQKHGIPTTATYLEKGAESLQVPSAQLKGIVVGVDAHYLRYGDHWGLGGDAPEESWHSVVLTGIKYDDDGEIVSYYINDTGRGACGLEIKKCDFEGAMSAYANSEGGKGDPTAITDIRVW